MSLRSLSMVLTCASTASASAAEPTRAELQQTLDELKARVARLDTSAQQQVSRQDVDATVASVLRDAEKRGRLLDLEGMTAGWDQGNFVIRSADGNFVLMPSLHMQFRSVTNLREDAKNGNDDMQSGFEIRRMRLIFKGNAFSPDLTYKFQWETNRSTGGVFLQDAFIKYRFADDWAFRAGQFWDIQNHEDTTVDAMQLACDRSLLDSLIAGGQDERVQGVSVIYEPPTSHLRAEVVFHDGFNTDNTDWQDGKGGTAFLPGDMDFGFSGRVDYFASGNRKNYDDFSAMGTKERLLAFGAGFSYSQAGSNDVLFHSIDVQYESPSGLALFAEYVGAWRSIGVGGAISDADLYDWGFLVQGSYLIKQKWEPFARFDYTVLDDNGLPAGAENNVYEVTGGLNYYFNGHKAQVTFDLSWLPNGSPFAESQLGVLQSEGNQFILRGQFQFIL